VRRKRHDKRVAHGKGALYELVDENGVAEEDENGVVVVVDKNGVVVKIGGGAQPPRTDVVKTPEELEALASIAVLAPLGDPNPAADGFMPHRTNELFLRTTDGRHCALDAGHSAMGAEWLRPTNVKRAKSDRNGLVRAPGRDCCIADVYSAIRDERAPHRFDRRKNIDSWANLISLTEGIFVALLSFNDSDGKTDKHFVTVDCWRRLILDNAEAQPIPFAGRTAKQLKRRIQCAALERTWQCMVQSSRLSETTYV
jgi:hypothetical protein